MTNHHLEHDSNFVSGTSNGNADQYRIQRSVTLLHLQDQVVEFAAGQVMTISPTGDVNTVDTKHIHIYRGEAISIGDIKGQCQQPDCQILLTARVIRYCIECSKVICLGCAVHIDEGNEPLCPDCSHALRRERLKRICLNILTLGLFPRRSSK